jgi:hypothetical protein
MPHDQIVTYRHLLNAQFLLDRSGSEPFLQDLLLREPDLADFLWERTTQIHAQLLGLGAPVPRIQRIYRQIETCILVSLHAQRTAHRELWDLDLPTEGSPPPTSARMIRIPAVPPSAKPLPRACHFPPVDCRLAIATCCPLCGSPQPTATCAPMVGNPACSLQCLDCGTAWMLIYTPPDLRPRPASSA